MGAAIVPCFVCQSPIASTAPTCPRCGAVRPTVSSARIVAGVFAILGAIVCAAAGLMLLSVQAQAENSLLELIAHGLGVYCLGRAGMAMSNALR